MKKHKRWEAERKHFEFYRVSRKLRQLRFYSVPEAGALIGLSRGQAYRAARRNPPVFPIVPYGKLLLVPREQWDKQVQQLLNGEKI